MQRPHVSLMVAFLFSLNLQAQKSDGSCPATVTDIDGNVYNTVQIGTQCWMKENLKVEHFRNGDAISDGMDVEKYDKDIIGTAIPYKNEAANKEKYGLLYNWFAVDDVRILCPTGWHVPTDDEWKELKDYLGGYGSAGASMKEIGTLKAGTGLWKAPNRGATNETGFSGLPGGIRTDVDFFRDLDDTGFWWTSTFHKYQTIDAFCWYLEWHDKYLRISTTRKRHSLSVRCMKD